MFRKFVVPASFLLAVGLIALLSACEEDGDSPGPAPATAAEVVALTVECTTAFRDQAGEPLSTEVMTLSAAVSELEFQLGTLKFGAIYFSGERSGEGRGLKVSVTTLDGEPLSEHLYQMSKTELPSNEFHGGRGFTGLAYVYDPSSQTEVQYWCTAS